MFKWNLLNVFRLLFVIMLIGVLLITSIQAAPSVAEMRAKRGIIGGA